MKRPLTLATFFLLFLFGLVGLASLMGATYNSTNSLPSGIYWTVDQPVTRDSIVSFCQPLEPIFQAGLDRGFISQGRCEGNYLPLMKKVKGLPGDVIRLSDQGILINDALINNSKPLALEAPLDGYPPIVLGEYTVKSGEYFLLSDYSAKSFDGRYYGPTPKEAIDSVLVPVVIW